MGGMSIAHWLVVGVIVLLLFGRGKISELMGDVAKGIKSFKKGMADDDTAETKPAEPVRSLDHQPVTGTAAATPTAPAPASPVATVPPAAPVSPVDRRLS